MTIAFIGGFYCAIGGVVLGLIVGFLACNRLVGTLVGAGLAFTYMTYSFSVGAIFESELAAIMFFASVVVAGGVVGLITVVITSAATDYLRPKRGNVLQS